MRLQDTVHWKAMQMKDKQNAILTFNKLELTLESLLNLELRPTPVISLSWISIFRILLMMEERERFPEFLFRASIAVVRILWNSTPIMRQLEDIWFHVFSFSGLAPAMAAH